MTLVAGLQPLVLPKCSIAESMRTSESASFQNTFVFLNCAGNLLAYVLGWAG
jgi:hypothetical protein